MDLYTLDDACAVLSESVEIVGESPGRPEARECVWAIHEFRTNRLTWEEMQAAIDAAGAAIMEDLFCPAWVVQSRIAVALAQYELDFQKAGLAGEQSIEAAWHQEQIYALDALNQEHAHSGIRFQVTLGVAA